jgi:hypothetical protein
MRNSKTKLYAIVCTSVLIVLALIVSPLTLTAQDSCSSSSQEKKNDKSADNKAKKDDQSQSTPDQDKKDKKKKKKSGGQDLLDAGTVFNERVANDVLGQIRDGLEGHSRRLMLSAFDSDKMDGYLTFEDQIDAFFNRYEGFRVHFRIANVTVEGPKGVVLVDAELEQIPATGGAAQRKRTQLRFELEMGRKGWRVVDFRDRGFFS